MYLSLSHFFGDRNTQTGQDEDGAGEREDAQQVRRGLLEMYSCITSVYEHAAPGGCSYVTDSVQQ